MNVMYVMYVNVCMHVCMSRVEKVFVFDYGKRERQFCFLNRFGFE